MAEKEFKNKMQIIRTFVRMADISATAIQVGVSTQTVRNALKKESEKDVTDKERECLIELAKRTKEKQALVAELHNAMAEL